jgi:pimeloyl-ACP methyl ester carboxylesterase
MRESLRILGLAAAASAVYGVLHDQVTARVSLEYFTRAHLPLIASSSPTLVGLAFGIRAAVPVGLVLGALLAVAARAGPWPRRSARSLVLPVGLLLVAMAAIAAAAGALAYEAARAGVLVLEPPWRRVVVPARQTRFTAVYAATVASYASGFGGGLALCAATAVGRLRRRHGVDAAIRSRSARLGRALQVGSLGALALLAAGPPVTAWWLTGMMMRPPWYAPPGPGHPLPPSTWHDPRTDWGFDYRDVSFPTEGGAVLRGWLVPAPARSGAAPPAVVLAGGGWSDRRSLLLLTPPLHQAGYAVLAFDYREHGQSDGGGRGVSYGLRESQDVRAAAAWLGRQGFARVAVVGYSLGGTAAILAAADDPQIAAVAAVTPGTTLLDLLGTLPFTSVAPPWFRALAARLLLLRIGAPLSAVTSLRVGPLYCVGRIAPRPLLLLQGRDDPVNSLAAARRLFDHAREPKQLVVVAGAGHLDVFGSREAVHVLVTFLDGALHWTPAPQPASHPAGPHA